MTLIGRSAERERLLARAAAGRHTLLVGPIGIGKTRLLQTVAREIPRAIYVETLWPLRAGLLALGEAIHARGWLRLAGEDEARPWTEVSRILGRLTVGGLADAVAASLHGREAILCLDQLERTTFSTVRHVERLLAEATVLGATRILKAGLDRLWWDFERVDLPPLPKDAARALLWSLVDREQVPDPALLEARVLAQASGNPLAIVTMASQLATAPDQGVASIRDLQHGAGVRYLDLTPVVVLVGAGLIAGRFLARGLDDRDLYVIVGSLGALFVAVRHLLSRGR